MKKLAFNPETLAEPVGHFERAVRLGPWLFISGTSAMTHHKGNMLSRKLSPGIEAQTRETLVNIGRVCAAAGYGLEDIYELRISLKRREDYPEVDAVLRDFFPKCGYVCHGYQTELLHPEMLIEIEARAYRE
ncbi:MAG TPA: RidA family protein [Alphaproteobacteria bacterium]|nr:RidA family protein [Alphaproteobacteria bacterium]